jgi:hypothetical protein
MSDVNPEGCAIVFVGTLADPLTKAWTWLPLPS